MAGRDSGGRNHSLLRFSAFTRGRRNIAGWKRWPEVLIGGNHAEVAKWRAARRRSKKQGGIALNLV